MLYPLRFKEKNGKVIASFPDLKFEIEAQTKEDAIQKAQDTFLGGIELYYRRKRLDIPMPSKPKKGDVLIRVPLKAQARIILWNEIRSHGLTLGEFAEKLGVSRQHIQHYVDGSDTVSLDAYEKALKVFNIYLSFVPVEIGE